MYDKLNPGLRNAGSNPQEVLICCQVSQVQNGTPEWSTAQGESKSGFDISAFNQSKWLPQIYATFLEPISLVIVIYIQYIWVNYNDLTATEPWNHN